MRATTEAGFRSWFLGIARNVLLEMVRHRRSQAQQPAGNATSLNEFSDLEDATSEASGTPGEELGFLWKLRAEHRSVIVLRNLFALDWEDVAAVLGRPTGSAARLLHVRARRALGERLDRIRG